MTTANDTYDNQPPNFTGKQIAHDIRATVFANFGANTDAELLACAAVLHRNGADDCAAALGIGYQIAIAGGSQNDQPIRDRKSSIPYLRRLQMAINGDYEKRDPITYSCGGCDVRWRGVRTCHCAACHRSFGSVYLFDKHRRSSHCIAPETWDDDSRLVDGVWRGPERDLATIPVSA